MATNKTDLTQLFPRGIATGVAFCNRDAERKRLSDNILAGRHSWIMGTRRFGKTSLVRQVGLELARKRKPRVHTEAVDLFVVHNVEAVDALLRDAVGRLSTQFVPKRKKLLEQLRQLFAAFRPEITLTDSGYALKLFSSQPSPQSIQRLLHALDAAAQQFNRRAVLVVDEFQQIAQIDAGRTIEGAIRSVAQETRALSFVFLGSEKSLLAQMFENRDRPLYRLCEKLELGRIDAADYHDFLQQAAGLRWRKSIKDGVVDRILELSDRHPYYVNVLCQALWRQRSAPSAEAVEQEWQLLLQRERSQAYQAMMSLATAQRAVLRAIALQPTSAPTSRRYLSDFAIAGSTMVQALDVLGDKDFVRQTEEGTYEVIDPLIRGFFTANPQPD